MNTAYETTFYIAISMVLAHFIYNLSILLLCLNYGVRVDTFQIFFTVKKLFLNSFTINKTQFNVGIVPINSFVGIHGMVADDMTIENIDDKMLIAKPKYLQHLVKYLPVFVLFICFAILLFFMNSNNSISQNFDTTLDSLIHLFKTLMGDFNAQESLNEWVNIKTGSNTFILIFASVLLSTIISTSMNLLMSLITVTLPEKLTVILALLLFVIMILYLAFIYRVLQTAGTLYGAFDTLLIVILFLISSYISSIILFNALKILPKHKFV